MLRREIVWRTPAGKRVQVASQRMVSFSQRHLAVMTFEVTMLDDEAPVVISSQILNRQDGEDEYHARAAAMGEGADPRKAERFEQRVLQPKMQWCDESRMVLGYRTTTSRMTLACAADHTIETDNVYTPAVEAGEDMAKVVYRVAGQARSDDQAHQGGRLPHVTRRAGRRAGRPMPSHPRPGCRGRRRAAVRRPAGLDGRLLGALRRRDRRASPRCSRPCAGISSNSPRRPAAPRGMGIPAKGVSGSGYGGHYFWDTEVYVMPFLTYTSPSLARNALRFRYAMLPAAKRRAEELQQDGALFPWRTINGEEASAYYAAGTAQYHIDADISYALSKYVDATGDEDFLAREAIDILVQTARMWADLGFWGSNGDTFFHIHGVTGPDEYTTVVNDNLFTNVMARYNLRRAAAWVEYMQADGRQAYERMAARLDLRPARSRSGCVRPRRCASRSTRTSASTPRTRTSSSARCGT